MSDAVNAGYVNASVSSEEAAARLREDFADLAQRVNMDLTMQKFNRSDPVSVELAIARAEESVDYHLRAFQENAELQSLASEIKKRFRAGIQAQIPR